MNKEFFMSLYQDLLKLRIFDEYCVELRRQDEIQDGFHSYQGQEAVAVGVCKNLSTKDYVVTTHRGQGHALAKGSPARELFAEMMGRIGGFNQGKAGPMNFFDVERRVITTSIVGSGVPIATGIALAFKMSNLREIVVCFFGDGATNTGAFHEGVNLASIWKLPVLFVCENNQYAEGTPIRKAVAITQLSKRAEAYGIEGVTVDGNDILAVYNTTRQLITKIRNGEGPKFVEALTYRYRGHYEGDSQPYRTKEEVEEWKKKDPILRFKKYLIENKWFSEQELTLIENRVRRELEEDLRWAFATNPLDKLEIILQGVR
jgi:TPP-dependent pyruvate/acetoin dehydrogenase alpha subunit